jgi:hypothetical protein
VVVVLAPSKIEPAGPARPHLVPLGRGGWSLWRWVWLRGAGFAARPMRDLGAEAVIAQLAAEEQAEARLERAHRAAIERCAAAAAAAGAGGGRELRHALSRLQERRPPSKPTGDAEADAAIEEYRAARAAVAASGERTIEVVTAARRQGAAALQRLGRDPRFREALTWQNRSVLRNAVDQLLEVAPEVDDYKTRERQRLVAKYAQRYLLKNDSIGFFGPIAWGTFDPGEPGLVATPGPTLVDQRVASFEDWAIEAVADLLSKDPDVRAVFTPRRRPSSWLEGGTLHVPPGAPRALTPAEAWLVARVDGERSVGELAAAAAADPASGLAGAEEAVRELERLGRENVITWGIEVPAELDHPERWLRERLARIEDPAVRARCQEPLDRLEAARAQVAQAAGDPEALDASIAALEREFEALTELASKRAHGRMYVGRHTFFEDCRRAVDARVGRAVIDALDAPLTLVLASARWYTHEIARRFRAGFDEVYDRALAGAATRPLPLTTFLAAIRGLFSPDHHTMGPIVTAVQGELQRRWADVVGLDRRDPTARSLVLRADECRARVAELFRAPCPGWPRARYQCPDVMLAAASAEAVARSDFLAVLGETHPGTNTLLAHVAHRLHPDRAALDAAYEADTAIACVSTIQGAIGRATSSPLSIRDHHVEVGPTRSWRARDHVHLAGDLHVERAGGRLHVRSRVQQLDHDIIGFMEAYFIAESTPHFKLLPRAHHLPRVTIDRLVVSRERWRLEPADFRELTEPATEPERVKRVNAWARRLGLPRYVFGTVPHEAKPFYVDLGSPIYIDVFVRYLAKATALGLSEMLPGPGELWLRDAAGEPYTSELRIAAVDPEPWSASAPAAGAPGEPG